MQPRFERRTGKTPFKLLEHTRLRAGYDFLLLRCASGEADAELGEWWTEFMHADGEDRESLLNRKPDTATEGAPKRRRRRGGRGRSKTAEGSS
jgi:poly(A) polymerase